MLLQTHPSAAHKLVAEVTQQLPPAALTLLVSLTLAHLGVVQPAYVLAVFLGTGMFLLLLLGF